MRVAPTHFTLTVLGLCDSMLCSVCRQAAPGNPATCINYIQGKAETLPFEDKSHDLVTASYLVHELPASSTKSFLEEARRVLKPGGVVAVVDGDPW